MAAALAERDMQAILTIYKRWTGASQPQIATMTGVPQPTISLILNGKRQITSLETFEKFAEGLDIPRERLGLASADPAGPLPACGEQLRLLPDVPAARPRTVGTGVDVLVRLWRADQDQPEQAGAASVDPTLWTETALDWLLHSTDRTTREPSTGRRVGLADVEALQTTTAMFADLDNRYGGGHARGAFVAFLSTDVEAMMRGRYSAEVGPRLFSAVAEALLLAAWMAYDAGLHGLAQRYFVPALHVAQTGGDRMLAGSVLSAMSHQASFLGEYRHAANLARASATGTAGVATPTLTAQFHAMEARAHARLGDAAACDSALSAAEREFGRRNPVDDPARIGYFDEAELSAEFGHCLRDLGRAAGARTWAGRSVGANADGAFPRSDFFAAMVLADAHLDHDDPEPACRVALQALAIGDQLKSARCAAYVQEFRTRLTKLGNSTIAREFNQQAAAHRLWTPAAA
ncbi:helix-turn-helix transcriptional regulator [Frankia sp. QA3]|uniref:helix-turn-helix domain-containing protein n=1 Tax=Frankia sp. QA3 TaxID=710111 RepID=UPI0002EAA34D|nr:helix-turn-helix transcriptional regulator [Frankia sp. QA3]